MTLLLGAYVLAFILITALIIYYIIYTNTKKKNKKQYIEQRAFKLAKDIGDKDVRCVSISGDYWVTSYYLLEKGKEYEYDSLMLQISDKSEYFQSSEKEARKNAEAILEKLPCDKIIEDFDISKAKLQGKREENYIQREIEKQIVSDRSYLNEPIIKLLANLDLSIVRMDNHRSSTCVFMLKCQKGKAEPRYMALNNGNKKYRHIYEKRVKEFISYFNEHSEKTKIDETITVSNIDYESFIMENPYLSQNLTNYYSIKRMGIGI